MAFLTPEQLQRIADELALELASTVWADRVSLKPTGADHAAQEQDQEGAGESAAAGE